MTKFAPRLILLASVSVALAALPGSWPRSSNLTFSIRMDPDRVRVEHTDAGSNVTVDVPGNENYARISDDGMPALPYRIVQVLLPSGTAVGGVDAAVVSSRRIEAEFTPVLAKGDRVIDAPRVKTPPPLAGVGATGFPDRTVRYLGSGRWHGRTIASFAVFPLHIEDGALHARTDVELTVTTVPAAERGDGARALRMSEKRAREIDEELASVVINPEATASYPALPARTASAGVGFSPTIAPSLEGSPVECVIITTAALEATYQRLADRKTAKGVPTVIRTLDWIDANYKNGSDIQETVRTFVQDAYAKWGTEFFLMGGDTEDIPARKLYATYYYGGRYVPCDLYFEGLDGTWNDDHDAVFGELPADAPDLYAEVYVTRLPASTTTDVDTYIDKITQYEEISHPNFAEKFLFLAEVLFPTPWSPGDPVQEDGATIAELMINKHLNTTPMQITRLYERDSTYPGALPETRLIAIDSLNAGYDHVFHIGHGYRFNMHCADQSITIPDADALTNDHQFSNLFMLNCSANAFDFDCLGEHFLKNKDGGTVSALGAANSAFATVASYYMDEYTNLVFKQDVTRIGEAHARSRLNRTPIALLSDNADLWTHYIFAALADPEMRLYNGPVENLVVTHADTAYVGSNGITVHVTAGGSPLESATVCLWKGTEDYQTAATNVSGDASFTFVCETPDTISVVVTAHNKTRYNGKIDVVATAGAYLAFDALVVDDDMAGGSFGNGDGVIDAGEIIDLTPQIKNTGDMLSVAAVLTLSETSPYVTVSDPVAALGPVTAGGSAAALDSWHIIVSSTAPDEVVAEFAVNITGGGVWNDAFARLIHAPKLTFTTLRADDSAPLGNGDGIITSGEQFRLYCSVKNLGTGQAHGITAGLADKSGGGVTIYESNDTYPDVGHLEEAENVTGFRLSEVSSLIENDLEVTVIDVFGRTVKDTVELRKPSPPSAILFDASLGGERLGVTWSAGASPDVDRYHVYRSTIQGGPYTRATEDAVLHTAFTDVGLAPNTRFYYVVTAVDESGNESTESAEASASTNPQQAPGWPNYLSDPSSNSPMVGDIDGDGTMEIIVGNDYLYAWHDNGQEIRDGDGEALTYGVFSDQGAGYIGPAVLAKLDADFGLDIVAASWSTYEVYCFNQDGTVLPGWPRPTVDRVRASMLVADLDGDETPEIIAIDQNGWMYAWNVDGSEFIDGDSNPGTQGVFKIFPNTPWWQYQSPAAADIDNDGAEELIIETQDSTLYVLNGDGSNVPGWPHQLSDFGGGGVAIGDIDNNGQLDIVVPTKNAGVVEALRADNTLLWIRWLPINLFFNPTPALADMDGDGKLETFLPSSNGKLYAIRHNGNDLPGWPVTYASGTWTESSPIIADITGDGFLDVILGDETQFINAWDKSGNPLDGFPLVMQDAMRGTPAVADLDRDGDLEIVAAGFDRTVYVWDLTAPFDPTKAPWPMLKANAHRNARYGYIVPTAAVDVSFSHELREGSLVARWIVPPSFGSTFDVSRAVVVDGKRGGFVAVARGVYPDGEQVEYVDADVRPGETYVYKITAAGDGQAREHLSAEIRIPVTRPSLAQNYPNPFNPKTTIVYYVPDRVDGGDGRVSLVVYDVTGARVRTLTDGDVAAGRHVVEWDGTNDTGDRVGSGVYFYRLVQKGFVGTKKMVLIK